MMTPAACSSDPTHLEHPHLDSKLSHHHPVLLPWWPQLPAPVILHTWSIPTWTPCCPTITLFYSHDDPSCLLQWSYTPGASPPGLHAVPPSPCFTPMMTPAACSSDPTHLEHPHLDSKLSHHHPVLLPWWSRLPAPVILNTWSIFTWTPSCPTITMFYSHDDPGCLLQWS